MYRFNLENIIVNTKDGTKNIIPKKINVFVGPNNSGKSRFLKEIRDYLSGDYRDIKIISEIKHPFPDSLSDMEDVYEISSKMIKDFYGNWMLKSYSSKPTQSFDMNITMDSYFTRNMNTFSGEWHEFLSGIIERKNKEEFFNWFGNLFYQYLGTEERLTICKLQRNYGFNNANINYLSSFKFQSSLLIELSDKVKQLFNKDIYLDTQTLGDGLLFRVGENFDYVRNKTLDNQNDALKLFSEKTLDEQGDGLKSFVSTFLSLKCDQNDLLLLDEPEAFLHPPLARQLGEMIGDFQDENRTVFIATHSIEILKGILSKNQDVNVIRITQPEPDKNEIKILDQTILNSILSDPLLRVSRVLEGVFCEKVIITEAEADELVYQELIEKIFPESGMFFAHGQNKQTLAQIAKLYQEIGIDYEIITDFDVLRVSSELNEFLSNMPLDECQKQKIREYSNALREMINNSVEFNGLTEKEISSAQKHKRDEVYHKRGIRFFDEDTSEKIVSTLEMLSTYHLHILKNGELETLLEAFGLEYKEKKKWIVDAINKIAEINKDEISSESELYKFLEKVVYNK